MRIRGLGIAALFWAVPLFAQSGLPIHKRTLANGLDVIVVENHAVPLVTVELDVKNGAFTETPEYNGLSHLYEHMFFKANRTIPDQERYLERLSELGAQWNGSTSEERVNYFVTLGVDSIVPALRFMEAAVRYPLFKEEELARERPVVLGEYDRDEASPFFHLDRAVQQTLWTPAFYSHKNVMGDRGIVTTASQEKMRTIQQRFYVPNNSALILSGDVTPEHGFALAEQVFAAWPRGEDPFATPPPTAPPLTQSQAVIVEKPVNSVTLELAWQGPSVSRDPGATYAADVFSTVLQDETSRFFKRLVASGLAFSVSLNYFTQDKVGPIFVFAQTSPDKLLAVKRAILTEVGHFADTDYVTNEQLAAARNQVAVQGIYERERASELAHTVGFWWAVAGLDYYVGYRPHMQAVRREDIAAYARKYMIGKPHVVGVLIAPDARAALNLSPERLLAEEAVP